MQMGITSVCDLQRSTNGPAIKRAPQSWQAKNDSPSPRQGAVKHGGGLDEAFGVVGPGGSVFDPFVKGA
jgi:hypothetical protein